VRTLLSAPWCGGAARSRAHSLPAGTHRDYAAG
jgi:hypothetical protein